MPKPSVFHLVINVEYPIDFEQYDTEEVVTIVEFLNMVERFHEGEPIETETLKQAHATFQSIIANKAEEKRIDKAFEKQTGHSIYQTLKKL